MQYHTASKFANACDICKYFAIVQIFCKLFVSSEFSFDAATLALLSLPKKGKSSPGNLSEDIFSFTFFAICKNGNFDTSAQFYPDFR